MAAATSSSTCYNLLLHNTKYSATSTLQNDGHCSFLRRSYLQRSAALRRSVDNPSSHKYLVVRNAMPEAAGDLLSSLSLPGIPDLSLLEDNPWLTGAVGLFVAVPLMVQRLLTLTKEVDMAAQTVEKIADTVGKVADEVDKAAEEIAAALPEGGLKQVVHFVEDLAEETAKDAQKVEDLMDKVEELDDKLEAFLNKQTKSSGEV
ncbi:hypothetical protein Salat_0679700 [Sesamum alatum]|uniref:Uncharacterized protein n=1 Tax=Sesamum alatum TaxID=300844 RepID=A0AAE1YRH6_9LAMI|nr:hypothetical protein Salat_0679700 [Sesamum alatum]